MVKFWYLVLLLVGENVSITAYELMGDLSVFVLGVWIGVCMVFVNILIYVEMFPPEVFLLQPRSKFKRVWKKLNIRPIENNSFILYHRDVCFCVTTMYTCVCKDI